MFILEIKGSNRPTTVTFYALNQAAFLHPSKTCLADIVDYTMHSL